MKLFLYIYNDVAASSQPGLFVASPRGFKKENKKKQTKKSQFRVLVCSNSMREKSSKSGTDCSVDSEPRVTHLPMQAPPPALNKTPGDGWICQFLQIREPQRSSRWSFHKQ